MNPSQWTARAVFLLIAVAAVSVPANAQLGPGDPKPDINIVGPTRDPADIRDEGLKQQNEPACAIRPGDGDCIICFFNDYRTVDILGHEDAWIGQAESCDAANTWTSRIVPGHPNHPAPIGTKFAADPRVIALPGMAIHGFIGGFRDQDRGVIAVQHWLENNKDDFDYYEPALNTIIVDEGTEGRFIDKPDFLAVLDDPGSQGVVTLSHEMENPELGTIDRSYPSGTLYAAYAVFTGSQSVKLLVKTSDDWGATWRNKTTKLTESQNLVTGITMTSMGNTIIAMWRQVLDTNDVDAVYYATTTNAGQNWSKPTLLTDICKFDQPSATFENQQATFRTNDFPWLANDGKNLFAFYSKRIGNCATGVPKIFMQYSGDGSTWSDPQQVNAGPGAEFMPAAFGARGKVQVAWYDTRRENIAVNDQQPFIADFFPEPGVRVNRKVDVYTARITSGTPYTSPGTNANVQISDAIQVNKYRAAANALGGDLYEIEASFANAMMYASGFLAFMGDYFAVTAPEFRLTNSGSWEANYSAVPGESNLVDFFVAYADHRDVRGDILLGDGGLTKPYTPPVNVPATTSATEPRTEAPEPLDEDRVLVASADANEHRKSAEGVEDAYTDPSTNVCEYNVSYVGNPPVAVRADRTRDANIYGALIRDQLRISSPVESRPLSGILRAVPFVVNNVTDTEISYRLFISKQPGADPVWNRASFRQKPDRPPFTRENYPLIDYPNLLTLDPVLIEDVTIEPNSSVARTVFIVSTDLNATAEVQVLEAGCEADCEVLGSITVGGTNSAGDIQQPSYQSEACSLDPECNNDVLVTELHNPLIENPLIENPLIENPLIENPLIQNMELENPLIENPLIENPLIENYGFENPLIENPLIENPLIENPLIENPLIENPLIENPTLAGDVSVTFTDETAVIRNDGNVTTAYNVDATVSGFESTGGGDTVSQLILWKQYVYGTARDCDYVPEARNQVLTTINNPDNQLSIASIDEPFNGEGSIILAPGEQGFVTYRLFGTPAELENAQINAFTASSQAANCYENNGEFGQQPGEGDDFYTCEESIQDQRELILITKDTTAPTFDNLSGDPILEPAGEANLPGGACYSNPVAQLFIEATDESGSSVAISCFNTDPDVNDICENAGFPFGVSVPVSNLSEYLEPIPTPVTCVATDEAGNSAFANVDVQIFDRLPPEFTGPPPGTVLVDAGADSGTAPVTLENGLVAVDQFGVDPNPSIECTTDTGFASSNGLPVELPAGDHNVTCKAIDASGNFTELTYLVVVDDVTGPVISIIGDNPLTVEAGTPFVDPGATATDNVDPVVDVTATGAVDTSLPDDYEITYTATDTFGNTSVSVRTVSVRDTTPPTLVPIPDITISADPDGNAIVTFDAVADDNAATPLTITCVPLSGSIFNVGVTTVTCTATDGSGNSATVTFDVTVKDTTSPTVVLLGANPLVIEAGTTFVDPGATATDTVDGAVDVTVSGTVNTMVPGIYTLTYTAVDSAGNSASATRQVEVSDTVAPVVTVPDSPLVEVIQGPTGSIVNFDSLVSVTDLIDPAPSLVCNPVSGSMFSPGKTTVTCTGTDESGNSSSESFIVSVEYDGYGIIPNKLSARSGSSNPLTWAWRDATGQNVDTSDQMQELKIVECDNPANVVLDKAGDPGSSGFRFKSDNEWEYNWQSDDDAGNPLEKGVYCARVTTELTKESQSLESPPIRLR